MVSQAYRENFRLIDWSSFRPRERRIEQPVARSAIPCPMVIRDEMEPAQHPCDGKFYDSKSRFRAETKAHGCIEVGNETGPRKRDKPKADRRAIRESLEKAKARLS